MTHPPTLPNGFSTDFSEAPEGALLVYASANFGSVVSDIVTRQGGEFVSSHGFTYYSRALLCWCPIPTPGDAVLKELAEGK